MAGEFPERIGNNQLSEIVYGPTMQRSPSEIESAIAEQLFLQGMKDFVQAQDRRDIEARDIAEQRLGDLMSTYPELRSLLESED